MSNAVFRLCMPCCFAVSWKSEILAHWKFSVKFASDFSGARTLLSVVIASIFSRSDMWSATAYICVCGSVCFEILLLHCICNMVVFWCWGWFWWGFFVCLFCFLLLFGFVGFWFLGFFIKAGYEVWIFGFILIHFIAVFEICHLCLRERRKVCF